MRVRIAGVRFLNTVPLVEGLEQTQGLEWIRGVPSQLHTMLESGNADIALVSTIDAARSKIPLAILDAGMIGSEGATFTVRLFATCPPGELERVWLDTDSHTSAALCRLILARRFGVRPEFHPFDPGRRAAAADATSDGSADGIDPPADFDGAAKH